MGNLPIFKSVEGHHHQVPFYLCQENCGDIGFEIAGGKIDDLLDKEVADVHSHSVDEYYLLVSPNDEGAEIEVHIDGVVTRHSSPDVIHVPAGKPHKFITRKAETGSFCFGILMQEQSSVVQRKNPRDSGEPRGFEYHSDTGVAARNQRIMSDE